MAGLASIFLGLITSRIVISCIISMALAQVMKTFIALARTGKLEWVKMLESGGMPSSHASTVAALTASVMMEEGVTPLSIAVLVFSLIVIRDAMGVRWITGQQSVALNKIITNLRKEGLRLDYLKVLMGHTPFQAVMGCLLGIAVTALVYKVM